jgi:hypothetical protein
MFRLNTGAPSSMSIDSLVEGNNKSKVEYARDEDKTKQVIYIYYLLYGPCEVPIYILLCVYAFINLYIYRFPCLSIILTLYQRKVKGYL